MIVTVSPTTWTVESSLLDVSYDSITLEIIKDCESVVSTTISPTISDGDIVITLSALNLVNGVYTIKLVTVTNAVRKTDFGCVFSDIDLKCKIAECVKDKQMLSLQLDYYILSKAQNCDCQCDDLCRIYKRLANELSHCQSC